MINNTFVVNKTHKKSVDISRRRLAEARKRQFRRRGILHKVPRIMTHGVGVSMGQFADRYHHRLPVLTKLTRKQLFRSVEDLTRLGPFGGNPVTKYFAYSDRSD